jgi:hypothetical protein
MTQIELMLLFKGNKTYCNDVFRNFRSVKYQLICERFKISKTDCDKLEIIWSKSK